jgi:hypothetical protein
MASKFIQIVNSTCGVNDADEENLYALDDEGTVWFYDFGTHDWHRLKNEAKTGWLYREDGS